MKNVDTLQIVDWLRNQNIDWIWDRIYNVKRKLEVAENFVTLKTETIQFNKIEQLDLLTLEIFSIEKDWPNAVEKIADDFLDIFPWENLVFWDFEVYKITPTWRTPTFTLKGQFKITLYFQVRYVI